MKKTNPNEIKLPIKNQKSKSKNPIVSIIMGSKSDWETMKNASDILNDFDVSHECKVVSAHRTPDLLFEFAKSAESRGIEVIIAGAGGAAHLPGMCASQTCVPVLGVPVKSKVLNGVDSLLSIVQMPAGIPVGTMAIGDAGAKNAALLAISVLSNSRKDLRKKLQEFREKQTETVLNSQLE
jgi:5-(carboxyamino)imidazole ribonucleotide mutase